MISNVNFVVVDNIHWEIKDPFEHSTKDERNFYWNQIEFS